MLRTNRSRLCLRLARDGVLATPSGNIRELLEEAERQQILAELEKSNWIVTGPEGPPRAWG